jgi:hypothetical protein
VWEREREREREREKQFTIYYKQKRFSHRILVGNLKKIPLKIVMVATIITENSSPRKSPTVALILTKSLCRVAIHRCKLLEVVLIRRNMWFNAVEAASSLTKYLTNRGKSM